MQQDQPTFFVSTLFHHAWSSFKRHWLLVYALFIPSIVISFLFTRIADSYPMISMRWSFIGLTMVYFLAQVFFSILGMRGQIAIVRDKAITAKLVLPSWSMFLKFIVTQFLLSLIVIVGLVLLIYPGIVWSLKYFFAPYLVVDKNMSPKAALAASAQMTEGIKWDLVAYIAAAAILAYSGLLTFLVGFIVSAPVAMLSYAALYNTALKRLDS